MTAEQHSEPVTAVGGSRVLAALLTAVLVTFTAEQVLLPALPPLAREIGLMEFQLGLVISVGAGMLVLVSPAWGRACGTLGHKRVMITGLVVATAGLTGFAVVAQLALAGGLGSGWVFGLALATRGALFGVGFTAVLVAAIAHVAAVTTGTAARTAGISRLGAAHGLSTVLGPALGGLLAFAGLLGPIWAAPVMLAGLSVVMAVVLPGAPRQRAPSRPAGVRLSDARVWPYLATGFILYLGLGLVLLTVGFVLQDRLVLDPAETVRATGALSFAGGLVLVATQGALVPRLSWPPARLLRLGTPIAVAALGGLAVAPGFWTIGIAMVGLALGLGIALPGYTTGPTLHVAPTDQGAAAALVTATNGLALIIGPTAGSALYQLGPSLPFLTAAAATAVACLFLLVHSTFRAPTAQERPITAA